MLLQKLKNELAKVPFSLGIYDPGEKIPKIRVEAVTYFFVFRFEEEEEVLKELRIANDNPK